MPAEPAAPGAGVEIVPPCRPEIVWRRELEGATYARLTVRCGDALYHVLLSRAYGMNGEVVGYRYQLAGRLQPSAEHAEAAAISAIERIGQRDRPRVLPAGAE
jgi:hypothetical protein